MGPAETREVCVLDDAGKALTRAGMGKPHLSALAYLRILKLARAITDFAVAEEMESSHLAEAIRS